MCVTVTTLGFRRRAPFLFTFDIAGFSVAEEQNHEQNNVSSTSFFFVWPVKVIVRC